MTTHSNKPHTRRKVTITELDAGNTPMQQHVYRLGCDSDTIDLVEQWDELLRPVLDDWNEPDEYTMLVRVHVETEPCPH